MALKTWYDKDIAHDLTGRRVGILGYGAQGRAQALNLHDSGADVVVGLRPGSASSMRAQADGLRVASLSDAVSGAELIALLVPDEIHGDLYREHIAPHAPQGAGLVLAHGFSVHYRLFEPRADLDILLVAPKGIGFQLRATFQAGAGVPGLVAVQQDATGQAQARALAYAKSLGLGRVGVMATSFRDETETDLFGEQVVLCGGTTALVRTAFEELVAAGYPDELAYFECLHELKLICDLLHAKGIAGMSQAISNTAEYGVLASGPRIVDEATRRHMREVLSDIQSGAFARAFMGESNAGLPRLQAARKAAADHPIERVGKRLRAMMPWLERKC